LTFKLMFNRRLYWIPDAMPFMNLGKTVYDPEFQVDKLPDDLALRGNIALEGLTEITERRGQVAKEYMSALYGLDGIGIFQPPKFASCGYLRFPVLLTDEKTRRYILNEGHKLGISGMYPGTVSGIPVLKPNLAEDLQDCPDSRRIASTLVTLPTHFGVKDSDIERTVSFIRKNLKSGLRKNTTIKETKWRKSLTSKNI
ncbi:MAG: hypothetical protein GF315_10890, partial [candidate division Zixibacteria bacterium]|nr:hypothetical protein [candidate division Zixibacteria bacterium]